MMMVLARLSYRISRSSHSDGHVPLLRILRPIHAFEVEKGNRNELTLLLPVFPQPPDCLVYIKPIVPQRVVYRIVRY